MPVEKREQILDDSGYVELDKDPKNQSQHTADHAEKPGKFGSLSLSQMTGWSSYFKEQFGEERWSSLHQALKKPSQHLCLISPTLPLSQKSSLIPHSTIPHAFIDAPEDAGYFLDAASVVCALAVDAQDGQTVLDVCAAPGGKSVAISRCLGENSSLVCNEISRSRFARLRKTLTDFCASRVSWRAVNFDLGTSLPSAVIGNYDRILVDAPCSSDRHTLGKDWSSKVLRENSERQLQILANVASLVRPGGLLVYATCALATKENDEVISAFMKKHAKLFTVDKTWFAQAETWLPGGEETTHGIFFAPDRCPGGAGPLFVARLRRNVGGIVSIR